MYNEKIFIYSVRIKMANRSTEEMLHFLRFLDNVIPYVFFYLRKCMRLQILNKK